MLLTKLGSKTSIAIELAYQVRNQYNVFWTQGSNIGLFKTSFLSIGEKAQVLIGPVQGEELIVRDWLDSPESGPWLLIVDNVESPEDIQSILPTNRGAIFFTASDREIAESLVDEGHDFHVSSMEPSEASALVLQLRGALTSAKDIKSDDVSALVTNLGCLPLAIVQAYAYIKHHSVSVQKFAQELQERMDRHSPGDSDLAALLPNFLEGFRARKCRASRSLTPGTYHTDL
jgi:hypothetical protein